MKILNKKKFIAVSLLILLIFFLLAILVFFLGSFFSKNKEEVMFDDTIILHQELIPPKVPSIPDDYYLVRPKDYQWTEDDIDRWFTTPDGEMLDTLDSANRQMIDKLLEAAP